jgi:hypothetical protein
MVDAANTSVWPNRNAAVGDQTGIQLPTALPSPPGTSAGDGCGFVSWPTAFAEAAVPAKPARIRN